MLLGQKRRRSHEYGAEALPAAGPYQGRRDQSLSASDISLQEPVHYLSGAHVLHALFYSPFLGLRRGKGEALVEILKIGLFEPYAGDLRVVASHLFERAGEKEQLVEDQLLLGAQQRRRTLREVDVAHGEVSVGQVVPGGNVLREKVLYTVLAELKAVFDGVHYLLLRELRVAPVNGDYPPRVDALFLRVLVERVRHEALAPEYLGLPVEAQVVPDVYSGLEIDLVEIGDVYLSCIVGRAEADHAFPAAQTRQNGRGGDEHVYAGVFPVLEGVYLLYAAPVLVAPRVKRNKVTESADSELLESPGPFLSDALDISDVSA